MGRCVFLLLVFTLPLCAAPVPKVAKPKGEPSVNGTWQVVERVNNGRPIRSRDCECWVFYDGMKDASGVNDPGNEVLTGARLNPDGQDPTALDLMEGRNRDSSRLLLDGDTLHVAIGIDGKKTRPAEAKPGVGVAYILFKRADDPRPKAK
jgi:hypothetical protein